MGYPWYYTIAFAGPLLAVLMATPVVCLIARTLGIVDMPGARKVHKVPTPRLGGIAIIVSVLVAMFPLLISMHYQRLLAPDNRIQTLALLASAGAIFIVGLLDDLITVPSKYKLLALLAAAALFCATGSPITQFTFRGHELFQLGWTSIPLTILWLISVPICINFIDGIDGLAGGIMAIAFGVLAVIGAVSGNVVVTLLSLALAGSLCGFLVFNKNPAKIFLGDCGSMFIGFAFAGLAVLAANRAGPVEALGIPGLVLSIPILDTFSTLIRRNILHRRSMFSAERGHIHHRLLDMGLGAKHTAILLVGVTLLAGGVAMIVLFAKSSLAVASLILLGLVLIAVFRAGGSLRMRDTIAAIRRNRHINRETRRFHVAFEDLQVRFRAISNFDEWWEQVCHAAESFDFRSARLPLRRRDGEMTLLEWAHPRPPKSTHCISTLLPVPQRRMDGDLRLEVEIPATELLELAGKRVALFARLVDEHSLLKLPEAGARITPMAAILGWNGGRPRRRKAARLADDLSFASLLSTPTRLRPIGELRVAIVHDFLYVYAGAEKVLEQIIEVYPQADLFSLFDFVPDANRAFLKGKKPKTSFIQRMPFARSKHRAYLPLMPLAIEQLDVSKYDLVISSSYVAAKGVITKPDQLHVCYCHTPVRFAWDLQGQYLHEAGLVKGIKSFAARVILHYTRMWDIRSANGVDVFLTNSQFVGRRIEKVYRRESITVHPPVDTERFAMHLEKDDYYLTVSRLVPYKRVELIVDAFSRMPNRRLVVVGDGPEMENIRAMAGPNVRLVGHQPADRLTTYMQHARAFIFAAEEDFGIVPVEAQACGTPVIAYGRGGVTESVVEGETGLFFMDQTPESIVSAVQEFEKREWDPVAIRKNAERFSHERFRREVSNVVTASWESFEAARAARSGAGPALDLDPTLRAAAGAARVPLDARLLNEAARLPIKAV